MELKDLHNKLDKITDDVNQLKIQNVKQNGKKGETDQIIKQLIEEIRSHKSELSSFQTNYNNWLISDYVPFKTKIITWSGLGGVIGGIIGSVSVGIILSLIPI